MKRVDLEAVRQIIRERRFAEPVGSPRPFGVNGFVFDNERWNAREYERQLTDTLAAMADELEHCRAILCSNDHERRFGVL